MQNIQGFLLIVLYDLDIWPCGKVKDNEKFRFIRNADVDQRSGPDVIHREKVPKRGEWFDAVRSPVRLPGGDGVLAYLAVRFLLIVEWQLEANTLKTRHDINYPGVFRRPRPATSRAPNQAPRRASGRVPPTRAPLRRAEGAPHAAPLDARRLARRDGRARSL